MKDKITAYILSTAIVVLLIIAGPAQAFFLNLEANNSFVNQGETIAFTAEIEISSQEILPIDSLILNIQGPETMSCEFLPNGEKISTCAGITIIEIQDSPFGFGYGYGYYLDEGYNFGYGYGYSPNFGYGQSSMSKLAYEIKIDSTNLSSGIYETKLSAKIKNKIFSKRGQEITITQNSPTLPITQQSNSDGACRTDWQCSEWSSCSDGVKTRTCQKKIPLCYAPPIEETISCSMDSINEENNPIQEQLNTNSESFSSITGAVTGVGNAIRSTAGIVIIFIFISVAIIAGVVIRLRRENITKEINN